MFLSTPHRLTQNVPELTPSTHEKKEVKNDRRVLVLWTRKELTMVKAQAYLKAGQHSLLATRAELDMTPLLHEIFLCQEQLDVIAKRRQPLVIKKRGSYASISGELTRPTHSGTCLIALGCLAIATGVNTSRLTPA
jgi:hypothetical protein